jgi:hypothetical protein
MTQDPKQTPLPEAVRRAAAELKQTSPPEGFETRLEHALREADSGAGRESEGHSSGRWLWSGGGLGLAVVATLVLVALPLAAPDGTGEEVLHHIEELEITLDGEGHTWLPLTLKTDPHGGSFADVHVEVPRSVQVASAHVSSDGDPACGPERCVHRFDDHPTHDDVPHLKIGVSEPGSYRIYVEHASEAQRIRQVFVVAAR